MVAYRTGTPAGMGDALQAELDELKRKLEAMG